ncbi:exported hypothetical protein [uncultured Desulfatiglans sp.]|nr:exported hypothetical protein [uncultured Desulfatiglans sp.]
MKIKMIYICFFLVFSIFNIGFSEAHSPYDTTGKYIDNLRKEVIEIEELCQYYENIINDKEKFILNWILKDIKSISVVDKVDLIRAITFEFFTNMNPDEHYDPTKLENTIKRSLIEIELVNNETKTKLWTEISHLRTRQMMLKAEINKLENEAAADLHVAGTYDTNMGVLVLIQNGNSVSGSYGGHGTLKGIVTGNVLKGDYRWDTDDSRGAFEFAFSPDSDSFRGKFLRKTIGGYPNLLEGGWHGKKKQ